jgi:transposase InsO family protein
MNTVSLGTASAAKVCLRWMDEWLTDLLFATRILRKSIGFTVVAVTSLALAIGANTTIFSYANELLFVRLGVPRAEELRMFRLVTDNLKGTFRDLYVGEDQDSYRDSNGQFHLGVFPYPSYQQLREQNHSLEDIFAFQQLSDIPIVATGALELVQIDHTVVDVVVVDELERRPIGRPWLTVVVDVATRVIMGYHLSLEPPSSTSVALALSHAVLRKDAYLQSLGVHETWPIYGVPTTIHLDNAKEFHSQALARGSREHGIELTYRPPGLPHYGGHIERLIGTLMGEIHLLPGTTFSSVADLGEYDSAKKSVMTLKELEQWLTLQICGVYHNSRHSAPGQGSANGLEDGSRSFGEGDTRTGRRQTILSGLSARRTAPGPA